MARSITLSLEDEAVAAYAQLQSAGVDADRLIGEALLGEAIRVRQRAAHAAELLEYERQHVDLEELRDERDLPHQIEYLRPPR